MMLAWNVFAAIAGRDPFMGLTSSNGFIDSFDLSTNVNAFRFKSTDAKSRSCSVQSYFPISLPDTSVKCSMQYYGNSSGFGSDALSYDMTALNVSSVYIIVYSVVSGQSMM